MHYNLTKPCGNCPFRSDRYFDLHPNRVEEIIDAYSFTCHKTVDYSDEEPNDKPKSEHCAGLSIVLEKMERPNQSMRIAERIGMYDHTKLDMNSPVYEDVDEYLDAIENNNEVD